MEIDIEVLRNNYSYESITTDEINRLFDIDNTFDTLKEIINYIENNLCDFTKSSLPKIQLPQNCPNCGAPIKGSICEYCDTRFY